LSISDDSGSLGFSSFLGDSPPVIGAGAGEFSAGVFSSIFGLSFSSGPGSYFFSSISDSLCTLSSSVSSCKFN